MVAETLLVPAGAFSPSKGMGAVAEALSDEQLPLLVAYQQLGALASSTRRVQRALEQNRGNFERQLARASRAALYIAWRRWKLGLAECARRAKLFRRAVAKFASGTKARAFSKWLQEVDEARGEEDDSEAKLRMVLNFMRRRKLARGWYRWVRSNIAGRPFPYARLSGARMRSRECDRVSGGLMGCRDAETWFRRLGRLVVLAGFGLGLAACRSVTMPSPFHQAAFVDLGSPEAPLVPSGQP